MKIIKFPKNKITLFLRKYMYRMFFTLFKSKRNASHYIRNYQKNNVNIELIYDEKRNIGDTLNPLIFEYVSKYYAISKKGKHKNVNLAMVGSLLGFCFYNCYVWGSGFLTKQHAENAKVNNYFNWKIYAVRGPLTRKALLEAGYKVKEIYGDPAILLPLIYKPNSYKKKYEVSVIKHYSDKANIPSSIHSINVLTDDYKFFIDEILSSKIIISSSLHGIIIAESYGVPCIWLKNENIDEFKFFDWYLSTRKKEDIISATSISEALTKEEPKIPKKEIEEMRNKLLLSFPYKIFKKSK